MFQNPAIPAVSRLLTESPGDTGVSEPISKSEMMSDALSVVGLPSST